MKIGVLTFHYGYNYGGVLQAYATQQLLKELGYTDVNIINCIANPLKFATVGIPRQFDVEFLPKIWRRFVYGRKVIKPFLRFRKDYLNETSTISYKKIGHETRDYDAIIVGSDQVWSLNCQEEGLYFFEWKEEFKGKKIAYAPCCGKNVVFEPKRKQTKEALMKFDSLSVRNGETLAFVKGLTGIEAPIVPDPTCLYDFHEMLTFKRIYRDPYIFVYQLGKEIQGGNNAAVEILRKKYPGRKVVASVIAYANPIDASWADEIRYDLSPIEWLNMIQYADMVFTDSFHGTIFSMRLKRPFVTYLSETGRMARFLELKHQFGIEDHIVSSLKELDKFNPQGKNFDDKFKIMKLVGCNYLINALK